MFICRGIRPKLHLVLLLQLAGIGWTPAATSQAVSTTVDAGALVQRAIQHRLEADTRHRPMQFLLRKTEERQDTTREIVETKDGDVSRLLAIDGKPLSADANRTELARLNNLESHPELQERLHKTEQKNAARIDRMLAMLPDAFIYRMEGLEPCAAEKCYRLSFTPNTKWNPPDFEAKFMRGLEGEVWISQAAERLTRLDARFISDVDFGFWGILGRVNKGGAVLLEQTDVGGNDWELTALTVHVTATAVKLWPLKVQIKEEASQFSPVTPGMGYVAAIEMLKKFPAGSPEKTDNGPP